MNVWGALGGYWIVGILGAMGLVLTLLDVHFPGQRKLWSVLGMLSFLVAATLAALHLPLGPTTVELRSGLQLDRYAFFVQVFVLLTALSSLLLSYEGQGRARPGFTGLLVLSCMGASLLAMASDLLGVLAGLVCALIPLWGIGALRVGPEGREGALKGMLVGALAVGLFGFGTAIWLVKSGTTRFEGIGRFLMCADWIGSDPLLVVGFALLLSGVGCFVAAVPFQMWFVDVMESLPRSSALFLSAGVMVAALAAVCRMLLQAFLPVVVSGQGYLSWTTVLHAVGLLALLVCNAMALVQRRLKRMSAYLAAGQAGLVLITLAAIGKMGSVQPSVYHRAVGGILVFLAVYSVNWVGLFVAVTAVDAQDGSDPVVSRLGGLAHHHPWLAAAIGYSLLCMAGMPLTAGFFSRLYLMETMIEVGWTGTAVCVALSVGLLLVMCLGFVVTMVMQPPAASLQVRLTPGLWVVSAVSSLTILVFGLLPGGILQIAILSAKSLGG